MLTQSADREMPAAVRVFRGTALLDHDTPDLPVVRNNGLERSARLRLGISNPSLKGVATVFQAVVDVVDLSGSCTGEVEVEG